jgi:hypothetical protein
MGEAIHYERFHVDALKISRWTFSRVACAGFAGGYIDGRHRAFVFSETFEICLFLSMDRQSIANSEEMNLVACL